MDSAFLRVPFVALALVLGGAETGSGRKLPRVRFETDLGGFTVEVDTVRAPITGTNFLRYVDGGFYRNGLFHRTVRMDNQPTSAVKIEVIQAGADTTRRAEFFGPLTHETTRSTGIHHRALTISMARAAPGTARDQFFICVTDQPELDFGGKRNPDGQGFATFGQTIDGIETVRKIHGANAEEQRLVPPVVIRSARRVSER